VKAVVVKAKTNHSLSLWERARVRDSIIQIEQINLLKVCPLTSKLPLLLTPLTCFLQAILSPRRGSLNEILFATASKAGIQLNNI
jgi:hypothetical protein